MQQEIQQMEKIKNDQLQKEKELDEKQIKLYKQKTKLLKLSRKVKKLEKKAKRKEIFEQNKISRSASANNVGYVSLVQKSFVNSKS